MKPKRCTVMTSKAQRCKRPAINLRASHPVTCALHAGQLEAAQQARYYMRSLRARR